MQSYLNVDHVEMTFPTDNGPLCVLKDVNIRVQRGEFISLIGHSGCGKSTVLNIVAGLVRASRGGVILEGRQVDEPGPDRAVVFQNHSLLPWLSVYGNVRLAVDQVFRCGKSRAERHEWTMHNLELVRMAHAKDLRPDEISGGMKQRVGIARALSMEPKVLLMDEPFGALDALTRTHMQDSLMEIHGRLNNTVIMITHDVDEAVLLSDRIVMMNNGPEATIGMDLEINLLRPRNRLELTEDSTYNHYRAEVIRFLHEHHHADDGETTALPSPVGSAASGRIVNLADFRLPGGKRPEKRRLSIGFIPLTDCAPLVVAKETGLFEKHRLDVSLSRETSWANIRDKVAAGMLDGAQMLAAMPLAIGGGADRSVPMVTALSLGLNGNGVTVSKALHARLQDTGLPELDTPAGAARALKTVIDTNRKQGAERLVFATVYPFSSHNYLLRYWLASAGIDPDRDIRLIVVPPNQMTGYLQFGVISGFCVGEPWNTLAVQTGIGHSLFATHDIWNNHPEKVYGVTAAWAAANPNTHQRVLMALMEASRWIDSPDNRPEVCAMLSRGRYVNAPVETLEVPALERAAGKGSAPWLNVFHQYAANFPWRSQAAWFLGQMVRWGQITRPIDIREVASRVYRPEIYRQAAEALELTAPAMDIKTEGSNVAPWDTAPGIELGPDRFFDGRVFFPERIVDYLRGFEIRHHSAGIESWLQQQATLEAQRQVNAD